MGEQGSAGDGHVDTARRAGQAPWDTGEYRIQDPVAAWDEAIELVAAAHVHAMEA